MTNFRLEERRKATGKLSRLVLIRNDNLRSMLILPTTGPETRIEERFSTRRSPPSASLSTYPSVGADEPALSLRSACPHPPQTQPTPSMGRRTVAV